MSQHSRWLLETEKNDIAKYLYEHGGEVYPRGDSIGMAWVACFDVGNLDMVKFLAQSSAEIRYENEGNGSGFNAVALGFY